MDCLSCGITSSPASREHIFSRWLLKAFGSLRLFVGLRRQFADGSSELIRHEYPLDHFKLKKICNACNTGWMHDLEDDCKLLLSGIIAGSESLETLSRDQRCLLARWAGKTAIVESHAVGAECPVDSAFLREIKLDTYGHPGRFAVAACQTSFAGFGHMQVGIIRDLFGGGKAAGNVILIGLPKLVFVCAFPMLQVPFQSRLAPPLQGVWPADDREWHLMSGSFEPLNLTSSESIIELSYRIELSHKLA